MPQTRINFRRIYIKIAVKTPILVIAIVLTTGILLYYFMANSSSGVYKQFEGEIQVRDDGSKYVEAYIGEEYSDIVNKNSKAFWYVNKEEAIYQANILKVDRLDKKLKLVILPSERDIKLLDKTEKVNVDIETGKETLLDRLFGKGANK